MLKHLMLIRPKNDFHHKAMLYFHCNMRSRRWAGFSIILSFVSFFILAYSFSFNNAAANPNSLSNSLPHPLSDTKQQKATTALLLDITGPIGPATQDFIERAIAEAEANHAALVILQLDTPGGLDTSMRGINRAILSSKIPVICYVAPSGARAASAGTFILYASHIAAMAPGTNIGAASPVQIGGMDDIPTPSDEGKQSADKIKGGEKGRTGSAMEKKATHDAAAYIRSLAELHNRNAVWGERAVREAVSLSAEEAYQLKVIDLVAKDIPDLLKNIDGKNIKLLGNVQKIDSNNLQIKAKKTDWHYRLLSIVTDPSIAYILLLVGIYGLFFEFANPGFILPGVAGSIAIILALYAFQMLPINFAGFALLVLGIVFMIAEIFVSSFGVLGIGGLIAFAAGSILLMDTESPDYQIAWEIIVFMTILTGIFFLGIVHLAVRSQRKNVVTGKTAFIGAEGVVLSINEKTSEMSVRILGEIWQSKLNKKGKDQTVQVGDMVKVEKIEGLLLTVSLISEK